MTSSTVGEKINRSLVSGCHQSIFLRPSQIKKQVFNRKKKMTIKKIRTVQTFFGKDTIPRIPLIPLWPVVAQTIYITTLTKKIIAHCQEEANQFFGEKQLDRAGWPGLRHHFPFSQVF